MYRVNAFASKGKGGVEAVNIFSSTYCWAGLLCMGIEGNDLYATLW